MRRVALALALAACSSNASESECDRATDHMIEIFTAPKVPASGTVSPEAQQDADAWAKALKEKDPTKAELMAVCTRKMTSDHVSCITAASDEKTLAACFE